MNLEIQKAAPEDAPDLTLLAHAAKRHWGYPEKWIALWRDDLTLTPDFISDNEVFAARRGEELIGFYALTIEDGKAELEHLWVSPDQIGQGAGRILFEHAMSRAASMNARVIEIVSDPNAEGFYLRMGARKVGEIVSEIEGSRRALPRLVFDVHRDEKCDGVDSWSLD
ncbi:MAG: GNAT family N-acetyltransferase [Acidobacteriota bacterium]